MSGVSAAHFARLFEQASGIPPRRYLLIRRIEQATILLHDTDLSIIEIIYATGRESLDTFSRVFHDIAGQSPSALCRHAQTATSLQQLDRVPACVLKTA